MADATDPKSVARKGVWVRLPPPADAFENPLKLVESAIYAGLLQPGRADRCRLMQEKWPFPGLLYAPSQWL
jgi:hypothetical protein